MKLALCVIVLALLAIVVGKPQRFHSSQHRQYESAGSSDVPVTSQYPFADKIITFLRRIATGLHKKQNNFSNTGFALIYNDDLYKKKIVSKKLENRDLLIFQKNLKKGTKVRITNVLNKKTVIAKVGSNSKYPLFNNSVISIRISKELELDIDEPYVEIVEILNNSTFVAKKAKTFDEEKNVANKAPIESISVNDLNEKKNKRKNVSKSANFNYIIKIADFYFIDSAKSMIQKIKKETSLNKNKILLKKISNTQYRVILGPFLNKKSLQKAFNDINILNFENIEFIKNAKNS